MNFFIALIVAGVVGFIFGKIIGPSKSFSWVAFGIALFVCLGGLGLVFGLALGALNFLWDVIRILFWVAVVVAVIWILGKISKIFGRK